MATTRKTPAAPKRTASAAKRTPAARKPAAATAAAKTPRKPAARKPKTASQPQARTAHSAGIATIGTLVVATLGAVAFGAWRLLRRPSEGTAPTDLMGEAHPDGSERALDAFRPDPTAEVPASEREQFRPALAQLGNRVS
jgi:hypothetical protein